MNVDRKYLARHLKILCLTLMDGVRETCQIMAVDLDPSWISTIELVEKKKKITVMEASRALGFSHVRTLKILRAMEQAAVVMKEADPNDRRRSYYSLTEKGISLLGPIHLLTAAITKAVDDLVEETGDDLPKILQQFQTLLNQKTWAERLNEKLHECEDK